MAKATVLRVHVEITRTEDGGRQGPVFDGYRGAMSFGETTADGVPVIHDAGIVFEDTHEMAPGTAGVARAWVFAPECLPSDVAADFEFDFVEGHRVVGHARVLNVLSDSTSFPLADVADAKTRPLRSA